MSEEIKGTPDLSRIISVIMENPTLIEEISALAAKKSDDEQSQATEGESAKAVAEAKPADLHGRREQLLSALKPYLSSERQKAIDSMMTFAEILEAVRRR